MNTWTRITTWLNETRAGLRPDRVALAITLPVAIGAAPVDARDIQPLDEIRDAVERHAESNLAGDGRSTVSVGRIDQRLRLPRCEEALETFSPPGRSSQSRATVGVRCHHPSPWTLYVSVRVETLKEVYAAARSLRRGALLSEDDLERVEINVNRTSRGYYTDAEQLAGMELNRAMRAGEVVTPSRISAPQLVERGQTVLLMLESSAASVSMNGEALQSGALGDRIRVKNTSSDRIIEGEIVGDSRVSVGY